MLYIHNKQDHEAVNVVSIVIVICLLLFVVFLIILIFLGFSFIPGYPYNFRYLLIVPFNFKVYNLIYIYEKTNK